MTPFKVLAASLALILPAFMFTAHSSRAADDEGVLVFVSTFASGDDGAIETLRLDSETGTLAATRRNGGVANPFFMALSPDRKFLYAIHAEKFGGDEDEEIAAFAIDHQQGALRLLNRQPSRGTASCYLDVDAGGKTLVVANYSSGNVASLPIEADGSLAQPVAFFQHEGSSVNPKRQKGPNAHSIVISPDNRFAFAADLGIDKILCYRIDSTAGKMSPNADHPVASLAPGSGPRHLCFHPDGKRLYVINELLNTITFFDYDASSGELIERQTISTLPEGFDGVTHTADLKITPNGKFLYGTNRGHDSIAAYRIADDGQLSLIDIVPSLGKGPQNIAITGDGKWLLCANMPGNNVVVFGIDADSGRIEAHGDPIEIKMPSCIMLVE